MILKPLWRSKLVQIIGSSDILGIKLSLVVDWEREDTFAVSKTKGSRNISGLKA